jgi:hypothetical protein
MYVNVACPQVVTAGAEITGIEALFMAHSHRQAAA